ncbi:hypothetical protein WICPIJ_004866 [Wickerhamomyces pijperi]|uniref:Methyltransferase OMS1, mitochondrial n=1 Tax=Wickerhamomyces pijperi TaxID=599730 RepID=A0A9P8TMB9_WICPI|nr:hypothetical protein WICPIJ_004866 [Wickerhamomyces pijperi]
MLARLLPRSTASARLRLTTVGLRYRSTLYQPSSSYVKKQKTKEDLEKEEFEKQLKSDNWFIRWGAKLRTKDFQKKMTWYYIGAYILFLVFGYKYMNGVWRRDKEIEEITAKEADGRLNEYQTLRLKELTGKTRTRDILKLEEYSKLKEQGVEDFDNVVIDTVKGTNQSNENILPARDTTPFYDSKAEEYDAEIDWEEMLVFMGRRRKWLMNHCKGDVLEVACGTGRNIKYLEMENIHSITFMDSSSKMMDVANKKFREKFPTYKNAAFVVGRAEDLVDLAQSADSNKASIQVLDTDENKLNVTSKSSQIKYDTIIETFGLCSHEDPVKALKNFETLLKPGGRIVLLEHGRGDYDFINNVLDGRAEKRLETWGCRWNLDIGEILDDSGLEVTEEKKTHMGTTWCIVAKKKSDVKTNEEMTFVEKYLSPGIQTRIKELQIEGKKQKELELAAQLKQAEQAQTSTASKSVSK